MNEYTMKRKFNEIYKFSRMMLIGDWTFSSLIFILRKSEIDSDFLLLNWTRRVSIEVELR